MSKRPPQKSSKRQKNDDGNDSDSNSDNDISVHFFVPGEKINAAVLVEYITRHVDRTAKITSAQHPTDKSRTGYNVSAKKTLNAVSIRDLINDSKDWDLETESKEYRRTPYDYRESDTARRRAKKGASEGGTNRPQLPRGKREDTQDAGRQDSAMQATTSSRAAQPQYGQAQYSQGYSSQSQPYTGNIQTSSYGFQQPGRTDQGPTNINITMNAAQVAPSRGGQPAQYSSSYSSGGFVQQPSNPELEPPPAYMPSATNRSGPQAPDQPGVGTFDDDNKPPINRTQSAQDRRGSTYDQQQQPARRSGR